MSWKVKFIIRWTNHLNPNIKKDKWSKEEINQLISLHMIYGNRWSIISKYFMGRTDNSIKNHFYSTLRRSLRRINKLLGDKNSKEYNLRHLIG